MIVLDIDMDYFLKEVPSDIPESITCRVSDEDYPAWTREEIVEFLEVYGKNSFT